MKTVILCNGTIRDYTYCMTILENADYIICADGGTRHAYHMGIMPDVIIGDLDSSAQEYLDFYRQKNARFIEYPSDKDKTDTEICIDYAFEFATEIILLGATGTRLDHTIANIALLKLGLGKKVPLSIVDEHNQIYLTEDRITLQGQKNDLVSLLPLSERVEGITTQGMHYELTDATIELGSSYGISNYFEGEEVTVKIKKGYLLVIKVKD